jgi:two-component system phosphate regulon sensor histidine kinase PhoR
VRPSALLPFAAAIAAVPVLALAVLVATGAAALGPALAAMAGCALAALGLAGLAARDLAHLHRGLIAAGKAESARPASLAAGLVLPTLAALATQIDRLLRAQGERSARPPMAAEPDTAIVQRLPDPLIVVDTDRAVLFANAAARAAFAADLPALLRHPALRGAMDRAAASGANERADLLLAAPVPRELEAIAIPLGAPPGYGEPGRVLVVLSDRTRERVVERMRADFVANVSHELRTPLASLTGFIDTLRGPAADDPPAQQRFLGIMGEEAARMNRLIDDLLSLSRIELVEHQAPSERLDLRAAIARVAEAFEPRIAECGMTLAVNFAPDLPPVAGDADQITQVVQNLLDNALKYAGCGVVRLSVQPASGGRFPPRPGVAIAVADQGPGIARSHIPRLTERFYRVDKGRSRRAGGTGLGLAIIKHIVNRHRGQLVIESEEGHGSTFSIWLPMQREAE